MDIDVVGLALSPPSDALPSRPEELAFQTVRAALDHAEVTRQSLDTVTLATSDEMDGRAISSMLMAAPSGSYLKDELRVTDSGMTGLVLGALRLATGRFHLGLVVSWSHTSVIDIEGLMRMRAEPFHLRPIGMNATIADGLMAHALQRELGLSDAEVSQQVAQRQARAALNPRGLRRRAASAASIAVSPIAAWKPRTTSAPRCSRDWWCLPRGSSRAWRRRLTGLTSRSSRRPSTPVRGRC
jgi:acetyl-CoA acetyltransferase